MTAHGGRIRTSISESSEAVFSANIASAVPMLDNFLAYQKSKQFYLRCKSLKLHKSLYDQLVRASSSVGLNLAEATGRRTPKDQRRHYSIAFGSLQEARTLLDLEGIGDPELLALGDELAAILYTLSRKRVEST